MNGIFSTTPCQSSIRLLVGTHLLLLVQAALVIWSASVPGEMQALVILVFVLSLAAFICALRGDNSARPSAVRCGGSSSRQEGCEDESRGRPAQVETRGEERQAADAGVR